MAATTYTYSISADVPAAKANAGRLDQEIRLSSIVTALEGVTISGDVLDVTFKDALSAADKTTLDGDTTAPAGGLIGAHTGDPLPDGTLTSEGNQVVGLEKVQVDGIPRIAASYRTGKEAIYATHNLCDKTTWYSESTRVTDETLTKNGSVWESANPNWIDMTHGKVFDEEGLAEDQQILEPGDPHGYGIVVKRDGVEQTQREPFAASGGDYTVDYVNGKITPTGNWGTSVVTASYSYAGSSGWVLQPLPGKKLVIEKAEVQFSKDIQMNDTFIMEVWGNADYFDPGQHPPGTPIVIETTKYKTIDQIIDEAVLSYPEIPVLGGPRGYTQPRHVFAFHYAVVKLLHDCLGMYVRIYINNDMAFTGERATATFYLTSHTDPGVSQALAELTG